MRRYASILLVLAAIGCDKEREYDEEAAMKHAGERYLVSRLAQVCDGRAFPDSATYKRGDKSPKVMAIVINYGYNLHVDPYSQKTGHEPKTIEEAQLVACRVGRQGSGRVVVRATKDGRIVGETKETYAAGGKKKDLKDVVADLVAGKPPPKPAPKSPASAAPSGNTMLKRK